MSDQNRHCYHVVSVDRGIATTKCCGCNGKSYRSADARVLPRCRTATCPQRHNGGTGTRPPASAAVLGERARIRREIRAVRAIWRKRMDVSDGFEGAARAVQALDEVLSAIKPGRRK